MSESLPAGTATTRVSASSASFISSRCDVAVCFALEGSRKPVLVDVARSGRLASSLARLISEEKFKGKKKEILLWNAGGRLPATRYLIAGLGKEMTPDSLRDACGQAIRRAAAAGVKKAVFLLPAPAGDTTVESLARAATEGIALGSYRMSKYQSGDDNGTAPVKTAELLVPSGALKEARAGVAGGDIRARATNLARDLVNEPAMVVTPTTMAGVARRIARDSGLGITVLKKKDLKRLGMGAILGVSAGSAQPPCVIHLIYKPKGRKASRRIALVGKGLTFDSGGLSLKTAAGMETMKLDKAGATTVLAVMAALAELKPRIEVHGIMGMTENMPGGAAIKPGDVLRTMGGKTIEVLNTDAEGRLVLADCLTYAQKLKVDRVIDLATLTGACMVALGPTCAGVFGNDQEMVDQILAAAREAGEKAWQLPLFDEYGDQIKSDIADIKNTGNRYGGAITAALFLKHFVQDGTPWAHFDIAGPAFYESEHGFMRKGATGATVRTLLTYIQSLASS